MEEMARTMCSNYGLNRNCAINNKLCDLKCGYYTAAKWLYKAGYRKQIEGEWIFNRGRIYGEPAYYCSLCSEGVSEYGYDNFCNHCGARMRGVAEC